MPCGSRSQVMARRARLVVLGLCAGLLLLSGCGSEDGKPVTLTPENFDKRVLESQQPVLVEFWFEACPPCRTMNPIIRELAEELSGKAVIAKVNVDDYPQLAHRFGIDGFPTFLIFKNGRIVRMLQGPQPKYYLSDLLGALQ